MELSVRLGLFFVALKIQEISGSEGSVCPCVRPSECSTLPAYGVNVLDIQQFGVLAPCVAWGHIRCCPRIKEDTPDRTGWMTLQSSRTWNKFVYVISELDNQTYPLATSNLACGCVPKGLCTLKKRATSAQCYGYFELWYDKNRSAYSFVRDVFILKLPRNVCPRFVRKATCSSVCTSELGLRGQESGGLSYCCIRAANSL